MQRFTGVDPLADKYVGWSPYHYVLGNPLIFVDPNGDTSRLYTLNGVHQYNINDNLPNEDHFLSSSSFLDLEKQCCSNIEIEGEYARSISEYYIGKNTRSKIKDIYTRSAKKDDNKERGFVFYLGNDSRELKVEDITGGAFRTNRSLALKFALEYYLPSNIKPIGHGHTHLHNFHASEPEDYYPLLTNRYTGLMGGNTAIIAHKDGIKIYSTFQIKKGIYGRGVYIGRYGVSNPVIKY